MGHDYRKINSSCLVQPNPYTNLPVPLFKLNYLSQQSFSPFKPELLLTASTKKELMVITNLQQFKYERTA